MASPNCTNTDISGIGIRSATYTQNLLSFVPAAVALFNDGKISNSEREFIRDQSTNILLTAFGLLLSAIIQAKTAQGLDNYHLALVLNLSWMNNTNTFIYLALFLHRRIWSSPSEKWGWGEVNGHLLREVFPERISHHFRRRALSPSIPAGTSATANPGIADESGAQEKHQPPSKVVQREPEALLDVAILIGSLHISLMGVVGVWLWAHPMTFGSSPSCPPNATISVLSHALPMAASGLRIVSLMFYAAVLIPLVDLLLPTTLILTPYLLFPLGRWSDPKKRESVAVRCVAFGLIVLFAINVIFIIDTELAILRNESRQAGQDKIWTLGQTLALPLPVLPIKGLIVYLLTTTSLVLPFVGETDWGRAVRGFRKFDSNVPWDEVYRWRWLVGDTPVKVDSHWLLRALINGQSDIERFLCENGASWSTAMVHPAEKGDLDMVRRMVEKGAEQNRSAAKNGHSDIVRFLVGKGANVNRLDGAPLYIAAKNGHLDIVRFLVEKGVDVRQKYGYYDKTPLEIALQNRYTDIVSFLRTNGA